jgi:hypothetical protein
LEKVELAKCSPGRANDSSTQQNFIVHLLCARQLENHWYNNSESQP